MKRLLRHYDKLLLVPALLLFVLAGAWSAFVDFPRLDAIAQHNPAAGAPSAPYQTQIAQMPPINQVTWSEPPAQSRGPEWRYDVFTPPVIYVNPRTSEFTVTPPTAPVREVAVEETPFEVELVRVQQEQYRLQLVGYAGDSGAYRVQFELVETGEVLLARVGEAFSADRGAFTLQSFDARQQTVQVPGSMPITERVGVAVVLDQVTGREITLTTRERAMLPRLQCVLRDTTGERRTYAVREGGSVTIHGFEYQVLSLSLAPQQAVVSRRAPSQAFSLETKTLRPVADGAPEAATDAGGGHNTIDLERQILFPSFHPVSPLASSRLFSAYP